LKQIIFECTDGEKQSNLVIMWRQNSQRLAYEWLGGGWDGTNASADRLDNVIHRLMTEPTKLSHQVEIMVGTRLA